MERGEVSLAQVAVLVLDEADMMLDMGFEPQIRRIVEQADMPHDTRQTLMFSATFPNPIQRLASDFLQDHIFLTIGITGSTTKNVTQKLELIQDRRERGSVLLDLLSAVPGLTIIFVETKATADDLCWFLQQEGFPATSIHGDRDQRERKQAIRSFKSGDTPYLVATGVASRGLDINNVAHVINFELPKDIDSYVHRIGRTGRAGNKGLATSFVGRDDGKIAGSLLDVLTESGQEVPDWLPTIASRGYRSSGRGGMWGGTDARANSSAFTDRASQSLHTSHEPRTYGEYQASKSNAYWD
jgi:ATP-dependent RNA helicase DDX3X